MRRRRVLTTLAALCAAASGIALLGLASTRGGPRSSQPHRWVDAGQPWGSVTGSVTDSSGRPVQGAFVLLQNLRGFGGRGRTDGAGRYEIPLMLCSRMDPPWKGRSWLEAVVPDAPFTLYGAATAEGFCGSTVVQVEARRGLIVEAPTTVLSRGGFIAGRTVDAAGREVAARVRVVARVAADPALDQLEELPPGYPVGFVSSKVGEGYWLGPILPGPVEIWATAPGVGGCSAVVTVAEDETTSVELRASITVQISGVVVDASGRAAADVQVVCRRQAEVPAGSAPPGTLEDTAPARVEGGGRVGLGHSGKPRRPLATPSPSDRAASRGMLATHTDEEGRFYFYGLREDIGHEVSIAGCRAAGAVVADVRTPASELVLRMPLRVSVRGRVVIADTDEPVEACRVHVLPESVARYMVRRFQLGLTEAAEGALQTGVSGEFETPPLFAGSYRLTFVRQGYEIEERTLEVGEDRRGDSINVQLRRSAAVSGVVVAHDGGVIAGATVQASCPRPAGIEANRIEWVGRFVVRTDAAGAFQLRGLPAGEPLLLRARDQAGRTGQVAFRLDRCEARKLVIRMEPATTLTVRTVPRAHGTLEGHPLRLVGIDDPDVDVALLSDETGTGSIRNLSPGRYKLLAIDPREDLTRPDVQARVRELLLVAGQQHVVDVEVPDIVVLSGVISVDGAPVRVGKVGFGPVEGTADHFHPLLFDVKGGRFEGRVPPGTYHAHVRVPGRRFEHPDQIVVASSPSAVVDFSLVSSARGAR